MTAPLLLRDVRLVGRDGARVDVLIEDGAVAGIAPGLAAGSAEVVDAEGRWLGPGLWDNHVHLDQWALVRQRLDVASAGSARETAEIVATRIRKHLPADQDLLVAYGFRDALWPDAPSLELLDSVSEHVPVAIVSADLHAVWLNTEAFALVGRPAEPSGLLREQAAFDASAVITSVDDSRMDLWAGEAASAAAARGVVGIVDLEMTLGFDRWARRVGAGFDTLRVRAGVYPDRLDDVIARGLRTGDVVPGASDLVRVGPFKIITDGSLGTRTAACHESYPGLEGHANATGLASFDLATLTGYLARASGSGFVPAVHAIGDRALEDALTAFERADVAGRLRAASGTQDAGGGSGSSRPDPFGGIGAPGSIEHAQLVTPAALPRMARLGLLASMQPEHAMDDRDIADHYWAGRTDRAFALASLHAAGVPLRLGSDAPVAPLDPWVTMAAAISRARDGRPSWHPEQRVLASVAFAASAQGRLAVGEGDVADLVLVDADPLTASDVELRSFPVAATLVGGRFTHRVL